MKKRLLNYPKTFLFLMSALSFSFSNNSLYSILAVQKPAYYKGEEYEKKKKI